MPRNSRAVKRESPAPEASPPRTEPGLNCAIKWLLIDEGGNEAKNDPSRAPMVYAIDARRLAVWTGSLEKRIDELDKEEAIALLYTHLWSVARCGELPAGLDYWVFDCAYRFSPGDAIRWLHLALGIPPVSEPRLRDQMLKVKSVRDVVCTMEGLVRRRMKISPHWEECKHWWTNRTTRARERALKSSITGKVAND